MKAVRFSLEGAAEQEGREEFGSLSAGMDAGGRTGSQHHLEQTRNEEKMVTPFMCCLCCKKAPDVSVWNCDGEILPFTNISCK